jgi:hypothetical protein
MDGYFDLKNARGRARLRWMREKGGDREREGAAKASTGAQATYGYGYGGGERLGRGE